MTARTAKHTPLPWKLEIWEKTWEGGRIEFTPTICTNTDAVAKACALWRVGAEPHEASEEQTANAELIVRAVNSHADLLGVIVESATRETWLVNATDNDCRMRLQYISQKAEAAIAKAEGAGT